MCCPPNTIHCGDIQPRWQKLRAISLNFTPVRLHKMLPLHLLLWNRLIALKSLRAKKPGGTTQGSGDAAAWIVCRLLFIATLGRAGREKQHSSAGEVSGVCWKPNLRPHPRPRRADNVLPIFTIVRVQVHKQYDSHLKFTSIYITRTMGVRYYWLHGMIHLSELWPPRCLSASFSDHLLFLCAPPRGTFHSS